MVGGQSAFLILSESQPFGDFALCAKIDVRQLSLVNQPEHGSAHRDTSVMLQVKRNHGNDSVVRPW
jgi:hypothetical protein